MTLSPAAASQLALQVAAVLAALQSGTSSSEGRLATGFSATSQAQPKGRRGS
jgi:hypothetical protein